MRVVCPKNQEHHLTRAFCPGELIALFSKGIGRIIIKLTREVWDAMRAATQVRFDKKLAHVFREKNGNYILD